MTKDYMRGGGLKSGASKPSSTYQRCFRSALIFDEINRIFVCPIETSSNGSSRVRKEAPQTKDIRWDVPHLECIF